MIVTRIENVATKRYKVYLDGEFAFVLYRGELSRYHIQENGELSQELFEQIKKEVVLKRAKSRALHLLNDMPRTEKQLRDKLKQNYYTNDIIDIVVDWVLSFGYINDLEYAESFIRSRQNTKSKREIQAALSQKGVSKNDIETAMENCYEEKDELDAIYKILKQKRFSPEDSTPIEKQKIYASLARKGFSSSDIKKAMQLYGQDFLRVIFSL